MKRTIYEGTYGIGKTEDIYFLYWTNTEEETDGIPEKCIQKNDGLNG